MESLSTKVHWLHGLCQSAAWHVSLKEIVLLSCKSLPSHSSCSGRAVELWRGKTACVAGGFKHPINTTCWKIHPSKQVSIQYTTKKTGFPLSTYLHPIRFSCHPKAQKKHRKHLGEFVLQWLPKKTYPQLMPGEKRVLRKRFCMKLWLRDKALPKRLGTIFSLVRPRRIPAGFCDLGLAAKNITTTR